MATTPIVVQPTPAPAAATTSTLSKILNDAELALGIIAEVGSAVPGVATVEKFAGYGAQIIAIISAAVAAHAAVSNQPLDLSKLSPLTPLP